MATLPENDRLRGPLIATEGQTAFDADFPLIDSPGDAAGTCVVFVRERDGVTTELTLAAGDFAVSGATEAGFVLTLTLPAEAGDRCFIVGRQKQKRMRAHPLGGAVRTPTLEEDARELAARAQEAKRDLDRAALAPLGEAGPTLPPAALRNKGVAWFSGAAVAAFMVEPGHVLGADPVGGGLVSVRPAFSVSVDATTAPSRLEASLASWPVTVDFIQTPGRLTPGDGGAALYKRVLADPGHAGAFASADGAWWELAEAKVRPGMFGVVGAADDAPLLDEAAAVALALGATLDLLGATYGGTTPWYMPLGQPIVHDGVRFTCPIRADGGAATALPALNANVLAGASSITLAADVEADLAPGDLIAIYDPADYSWIKSWNAGVLPAGQFAAINRKNYRAGEMQTVLSVEGAVVTLNGALRAPYLAAAVQVWKMPNRRLMLSGGAVTIEVDEAVSDSAALLRRVRETDLTEWNVIGGRLEALQVSESYNVTGHSMVCNHRLDSGAGYDYGLALTSCENVTVQGDFSGHRHGWSWGSSSDLPGNLCLPWRNLSVNVDGGLIVGRADVGGVGGHGGGDGYKLGGTVVGGILNAGNNGVANCVIVPTSGMASWPLIDFTECWGWDFDMSGCRVIGAGINPVPIGKGLIDAGSNGAAPDNGTVRSGTTRLPGYLRAPDTVRPIKMRRNNVPPAVVLTVEFGGVSGAPINALIDINTATGTGGFDLRFRGFSDDTGNVGLAVGADSTIRDYPFEGSKTYDPPSLADGAQTVTGVTVPGARLGDMPDVSFDVDMTGVQLTAYVNVDDNVVALFRNNTGGVVDLVSGTLAARIIRR